MDYLLVVFKTIVIFSVVMLSFRIMGNQAVGRLMTFDLVIVIGLGTLMGAPLADDSLNLFMAMTVVVSLVFLQRLTAFLTLKSKWFAKIANGEPIKLIEQGKVSEEGLKKLGLLMIISWKFKVKRVDECIRCGVRLTLKKFLQLEFPHIPIYSEELTLSHVLNELGIDNVDCIVSEFPFTFKKTVMKMIS